MIEGDPKMVQIKKKAGAQKTIHPLPFCVTQYLTWLRIENSKSEVSYSVLNQENADQNDDQQSLLTMISYLPTSVISKNWTFKDMKI